MAKTSETVTEAPVGVDKYGTRITDVLDVETGALLCRIAYYHDGVLIDGLVQSFGQLVDYLPAFLKEVARGRWGAFLLDSTSFAALMARKWHEHTLNPNAKHAMQWHGGSTDEIEKLLLMQVPSMTCHAAVVCHESKVVVEGSEEGEIIRTVFLPGKRLASTQMVAAAFPEMYRLYIARDADGNKVRRLQTDIDEKWQAGSVIGVPDGVKAEWHRIVKHLKPGEVWHGIVYSPPFGGKSTLLSGLVKWLRETGQPPAFIACFDARGKDIPYLRLGTAVPGDPARKK